MLAHPPSGLPFGSSTLHRCKAAYKTFKVSHEAWFQCPQTGQDSRWDGVPIYNRGVQFLKFIQVFAKAGYLWTQIELMESNHHEYHNPRLLSRRLGCRPKRFYFVSPFNPQLSAARQFYSFILVTPDIFKFHVALLEIAIFHSWGGWIRTTVCGSQSPVPLPLGDTPLCLQDAVWVCNQID